MIEAFNLFNHSNSDRIRQWSTLPPTASPFKTPISPSRPECCNRRTNRVLADEAGPPHPVHHGRARRKQDFSARQGLARHHTCRRKALPGAAARRQAQVSGRIFGRPRRFGADQNTFAASSMSIQLRIEEARLGADTDSGAVYLSLGPPSRVTRIPSSRILPLEIWYYDTVPGLLNTELRLRYHVTSPWAAVHPKLYSTTVDTIRALFRPEPSHFGPNDAPTKLAIRLISPCLFSPR